MEREQTLTQVMTRCRIRGGASMEQDQILDQIKALGLEEAAFVEWDSVPFMKDVRRMCEMNTCGNYGSNWMCPPAIGEMEVLRDRLRGYDERLLVGQVRQLEDSFDYEGMMQAKDELAQNLYRIGEMLEQGGAERPLLLGAGGCRLCKRCTYPDQPCRNPDKALHPIESYGIHVVQLCAKIGFRSNNGPGTVTNFGMVFFNYS